MLGNTVLPVNGVFTQGSDPQKSLAGCKFTKYWHLHRRVRLWRSARWARRGSVQRRVFFKWAWTAWLQPDRSRLARRSHQRPSSINHSWWKNPGRWPTGRCWGSQRKMSFIPGQPVVVLLQLAAQPASLAVIPLRLHGRVRSCFQRLWKCSGQREEDSHSHAEYSSTCRTAGFHVLSSRVACVGY